VLDPSVPALLVKVGRYQIHHGGLGAIRSLGRLGVPVYALSERRVLPATRSRYLAGTFPWSATGHEDLSELAARLRTVGERLGRRTVAVAGDDEAAILLAEQAPALREHFLLPPIAAHLPRELNSKRGLYEHCVALGIPAPRTFFPRGEEELRAYGRELGYPLIAKNVAAYGKITNPLVAGTVVVPDETALLRRFRGRDLSGLLLQEYLPHEHAEDWFVHFFAGDDGTCLMNMSARKLRSWPPGTGPTALARAEHNPAITEIAAHLAKSVGYCGIGNMDIRYDKRDGQYKAVDFNPRIGANFRTVETEAGVNSVRALHLHLTGRTVPQSPPDTRRRLVVETNDYKARLAYAWRRIRVPATPRDKPVTVRGWWAPDDPLPYLMMLAYETTAVISRLAARLKRRPR
jgi:predicted ATP-grasp superfamily ATP-dependent carboligase